MHVMIDLETLDIRPSAVVLSIGAVEFDPQQGTFGQEFHHKLQNVDEQLRLGRTVSASTLAWWVDTDPKMLRSMLGEKQGANRDFNCLIEMLRAADGVWGNGAAFDNVVLRSLLQEYGFENPWPYWNDRCFRTYVASFDPYKVLRPQANDHDALRDAQNQAQWLINIIKELDHA